MILHVLSRRGRATTADEICAWDAPSSELGLDTGAAPVESADPAAGAAAPDSTSDTDPSLSADAGADGADVDADADGDDDGSEQDPLDLLTERETDDPADKTTRTIEDRYKALSKRSRKLEKSLKKSLPVMTALREAGVDLRTLLGRHQTLANLEANLERNPKLRALLNGEADDPAARTPSARSTETDETKYPFDTSDDVGRFISGFHKDFRTQQTTLGDRLDRIEKMLGGRVERIEAQTAHQQRVTVEREWKGAVDAATATLDKGVKKMFGDAVHSAMERVLSGRLDATPQQIIDHYLKELKVSTSSKQVASAAARERMASRNSQLPRRPGSGSGTPASPRSRAVPRLEAFNRNIQRKFGAA